MKLSASSLERVFACPGSYWAEQGITAEQGAAAAEGELLHKVMAGEAVVDLNREQKRLIEICKEAGAELRARVFGDRKPAYQIERYIRWSDPETGGIVSTKIDCAMIGDSDAVIIDWKFGRNPVDAAEVNHQLRAYALAITREYPELDRITVAIVQPYAERENRITTAMYEREDLGLAAAEFRGLFRVLNGMEQKPETRYRNPGEHCRYCKALGTARCPESAEMAQALIPVAHADLMPRGADLAQWLDRCEVASDVVDLIRNHAKAVLASGEEIPGWRLKPGRAPRIVPDVSRAWARLDGVLTPEQFMAACKVNVTPLEEAYGNATGTKGKALGKAFAEVMGDALTTRQDSPTLERVK